MAAALRQMRPAPPEGDEGLDESSHDAVPDENIVESDNGSVQTGDVHTDTCSMDMAALERRLQKYIDEKFVQLQMSGLKNFRQENMTDTYCCTCHYKSKLHSHSNLCSSCRNVNNAYAWLEH